MSEKEQAKQELTVENFPGKTITLPDKSTTKHVYIVKVEDPSMKSKISTFVTAKIDVLGFGVDFVGYLIPTNKSDSVKTIQDAVEIVNKGNKELYSIRYPWNRVANVRTVSYRLKQ